MPKLKKRTDADMSAALGSNAVIRKYRNQTILSTVTRPRKSKSPKRKEINDRFKSANQWAKEILKRPGMKELYTKGVNTTLSNPHTVAVSDYLAAPVVHYINLKDVKGKIGDPIRIKATDNFRVTEVHVIITNTKGVRLEDGMATRYPRKPAMWVYRLTVEHTDLSGTKVDVHAYDLPGNYAGMIVKF
jgi:hypothetical protein